MFEFVRSQFVSLVEHGRTYVFLAPIYVLLLSGERIAHALTTKRKWNDRDGVANLLITGADLVRDAFFGHILPLGLIVLLFERARLFTLPTGALGLCLAFLLYDLAWYGDHRLSHRTGLFWAFHSVHHSSREYNFTVASRGFVLDSMVSRPLFYLLPILGVSPFQYIAVQIFTNVFGIAQHTRLIGKLGLFDWLLATPSSHRVHHGADPEYLDRNYGEVLMIWDHLFGSYTPEVREPTYGLTTNIDSYNPLWIEVAGIAWLVRRMRSATRLRDRLAYLYRPPEWQHEDAPAVDRKTEELVVSAGQGLSP